MTYADLLNHLQELSIKELTKPIVIFSEKHCYNVDALAMAVLVHTDPQAILIAHNANI
jgi:hypothetical protein